MELRLNPLNKLSHQFTQAFTAVPLQPTKRIIMDLDLVEDRLHHSYVYQTPLHLTYEYYNRAGLLVQRQMTATVESPIQTDRRIALYDVDRDYTLLLSTEQILNAHPTAFD